MEMKLSHNDFILDSSINIEANFTIIYGLNGSGKTMLLKKIIEDEENHRKCRTDKNHLIYLPIWRNEKSDSNYDFEFAKNRKNDVQLFEDINIQKQISMFLNVKEYRETVSLALSYVLSIDKEQDIIEIMNELFPPEYINLRNFDMNSDGVKSILSILCISIYNSVNIDCENNSVVDILKSIKGYILIDEIDCYLHQKIQYKIIGFLGRLFTNAKFLLTTHSPVILKSTRNSNKLYKISNQKIDLHESRYFDNLDSILKEEFDIDFFEDIPNDSIILLKELSNKGYLIDEMTIEQLKDSIDKISILNTLEIKFKLKQRQVDWMEYILRRLSECLKLKGNMKKSKLIYIKKRKKQINLN